MVANSPNAPRLPVFLSDMPQVVLLQKHLARALHSSQLTGVRTAGGGY